MGLKVRNHLEAKRCAILEGVVRAGSPTVRPDYVLAALKNAGGLALTVPPMVTRRAQGMLTENVFRSQNPLPPIANKASHHRFLPVNKSFLVTAKFC